MIMKDMLKNYFHFEQWVTSSRCHVRRLLSYGINYIYFRYTTPSHMYAYNFIRKLLVFKDYEASPSRGYRAWQRK